MKNIVLIHLESLNFLNYKIHSDLFPTIREWEKKSLSFSKYYSSATSTLMVMSDIAYGNMLHNEPCGAVQWKLKKKDSGESFLNILKRKGYRTFVAGYPGNNDFDSFNNNTFIGQDIYLDKSRDYKEYIDKVEDFIGGDSDPFVLWACDFISNVSNNVALGDKDGYTRWEDSYKTVDSHVGHLMRLIENANLLDNTTIIFYGDHGDDFFSHGICGGLSHANEPFETLIHTPMFIYDSGLPTGSISQLISSVDLKEIILSSYSKEGFTVNVHRTYAISRNLFAGQTLRSGVFNKGYSITDGKYLLLISDYGMMMFFPSLDPTCHHNILEHFQYENGVLTVDNQIDKLPFAHFRCVFDNKMLEEIRKSFLILKNVLEDEIKKLYIYAECEGHSSELCMTRIHKMTEETNDGADNRQDVISYGLFKRGFVGKRIAIYGAGEYGKYCYRNLEKDCEIVAWFDKDVNKAIGFEHIQLRPPEEVAEAEFESIYIAILNGFVKQEIQEYLMELGIERHRIY